MSCVNFNANVNVNAFCIVLHASYAARNMTPFCRFRTDFLYQINFLWLHAERHILAYEISCMSYYGFFSLSNFNGSQQRIAWAICNFATPKSRELPDAPLSPPFLSSPPVCHPGRSVPSTTVVTPLLKAIY